MQPRSGDGESVLEILRLQQRSQKASQNADTRGAGDPAFLELATRV
jgi:hypothetical protein